MGSRSDPFREDPVVALYSVALPRVYGYLLTRCGSTVLAEDLTAETFMAAVAATRDSSGPHVTVAWLIGIARHKLVDHWRRIGREQRTWERTRVLAETSEDPWDDLLDIDAAHSALARLATHHRVGLTLRYLDGLPVADVAEQLGRSVHATETLLVRARIALRRVYREGEEHGV